MSEPMRVMVVSHGHPDLSPGGAENASYALFQEFRDRPGIESLYVARVPPVAGQTTVLAQHNSDGTEVLLRSDAEHFRQSQRHHPLVNEDFRSLLDWFRPTVVHFHHYSHLGLELLREVRNFSPEVPIVLTLHEFQAICTNNGQMVKTDDGRLCESVSPAACQQCFPDRSAEEFLLRELFIKSFLSLVDTFVSPSQFLIERYVAWGLPREKFVLIENAVKGFDGRVLTRSKRTGDGRRFGFFGQIHPGKGLHVLLDAMSRLPEELRIGPEALSLDIHGARLSEQKAEYQTGIHEQLAELGQCARLRGPYAQGDLPGLMGSVDWVVVPSTWWENSPLVIQEAFANGVPVICSDIGGMAEKVRDGVDGLHFRVGDAAHLADRIAEGATTPGLQEHLSSKTRMPPTSVDVGDRHVQAYQGLLVPSTPLSGMGDYDLASSGP